MGGTDTLNGGAGNDVLIGITPNPANPEALLDGLDPTELGVAIEGLVLRQVADLDARIADAECCTAMRRTELAE